MIVARWCLLGALPRLLWPLLAGLALAWVLMPAPVAGLGEDAAQATALGLHLPAFLLSAGALAAALELWPPLSQRSGGGELLLHLQRSRLEGCAAASVGVLVALVVGLAVAGAAFTMLLGMGREPVRAHHAFPSNRTQSPVLPPAGSGSELRFDGGGKQVNALELRPLLFMGAAGYQPAAIRVRADGVDLHDEPLLVRGSHEVVELRFAPREVNEIAIARAAPGPAVVFPAGSVHGVAVHTQPAWLNGALAAMSYALPAAVALALLSLLRRRLALPVALMLGVGVLALTSMFELTPNVAAIAAHARGRWLGSEELFGRSGAAAGAAAVLLALASVPGRRRL